MPAVAAWVVALAPVLLGWSLVKTVSLWAAMVAVSAALASRDPVGTLVVAYAALTCVPVVDYLTPAPWGFVGGAPGGLAWYPPDLLLVAAALTAARAARPLVVPRPLRPVLVAGLIWLVLQAPAVVHAQDRLAAAMQWGAMARAILAGLVVSAWARPRQVVAVLLAGGFVQGLLAAAQHFRPGPLGLTVLGEAQSDQLFKYISYGVGLWRAGGTVGHPNVLASYLLGLCAVALGLALAAEVGRVRVMALGALASMVAGIVWTYSRAAWAAAGAVAVAVMAARPLSLRVLKHPAALMAAAVAVAVAGPSIWLRLHKTDPSAAHARWELVGIAAEMLRSSPWTGVALNQFASHVARFDATLSLPEFRHPVHNIVLLDAAEGGVPGAVAGLLLWGTVLAVCLNEAWRARGRGPDQVGLWAAPAAVVLHNAVDWTLRRPVILLLVWILLAVASSETERGRDPR